MPLQQTSGNVTSDAYGGGTAVTPVYIEDVMSTFLYTGNGSTQTITNGIDLSTKGGLVWLKGRQASAVPYHFLMDSARGKASGSGYKWINSNTTDAEGYNDAITDFNSNGFNLGSTNFTNDSGFTFASWTFRKQPKFFDVVTYTGNGSNKTISHNLGSAPGCIIVKRTDSTGNWFVYHSSLAVTSGRPGFVYLDSTSAVQTGDPTVWPSVPTSTTFEVGSYIGLNASGGTYVAYLFAHNAGGFGLTGTENVISCGSFTTDGSGNATVNLGYEPQYVLMKRSSGNSDWGILDNMRGWAYSGFKDLYANSSSSEGNTTGSYCVPTATGFTTPTAGFLYPSSTYVYIAIRRGPMKTPTDAIKVFSPIARSGTGTNYTETTNTNPDSIWLGARNQARGLLFFDKLRGLSKYLTPNSTNAEGTNAQYITQTVNTGYVSGNDTYMNDTSQSYIDYSFTRAPSFFDEVCFTGDGTYSNKNHNLGVAPELVITKSRSGVADWVTGYLTSPTASNYVFLNKTNAATAWGSALGTSTTFIPMNDVSGVTFVNYLFSSCPGVSKVGSYTGNGSTQTINCGFTGGARFVLIKRTDSTGDWYVYDTARGMTTLTDPYLRLNSTAAESATLGSVTTVSTGFAVNASILAAINTNAASYIFLAIA